jgi:hypothetical protein
MGYTDAPIGLHVTVDGWDDLGDGTVRTPILELSGFDYDYVKTVGVPYPGMLAVSDVGAIYEYQPFENEFGGLFKRIAKGLKKVAKKGGELIAKGAKNLGKAGVKFAKKKIKQKLEHLKNPMSAMIDPWKNRLAFGKKILSKTKWGRAAIKVGSKALKTSMKIVKPLAKHVGTWAPRLAPVAALIPGVGPAISGAMLSAGTIANKINQYGGAIENALVMDQKTGAAKMIKKLAIDPKNRVKLASDLYKEAKRFQRAPNSQIQELLTNLKKMSPRKFARPIKPLPKATVAAAAKLQRMARSDYNRDVAAKVRQVSGGNAAKQARINALVQQLIKLGYPVA